MRFATVIATIVWTLLTGASVAQERHPNVVFFLVDDLGWRDLGCFGSEFYDTPNIDSFAAESVKFSDAYAACHVCSPTRASILTGKYPATLQLTDWLPGRREFDFQRLRNAEIHPHLPLEEVTIAEVLKAHGYATGHFGKWHLGEEPYGPTSQGFDVQLPRWNKGWPNAGYHAPFRLEGLEESEGDYLTDRLTDEAIEFIDDNKERPFFLYLSHYAVHDPIQGRADLVDKYQAKRDAVEARENPDFILEGNPDSPDFPSREEATRLIELPEFADFQVLANQTVKIKQNQDNPQFAAMVESVDESLGRVRQKLEELGLANDTIIILFSDNGGMSGANFGRPTRVVDPSRLDGAFSTSNLPLRGAKGWLYEGGIRVPLIVHWPTHGQKGATCEEPIISVDFFPTILDMIGLETENEMPVDGVSFASLLSGEQSISREAIFWHFPHYSNHGMQSPGGAIRMGDYKLLEYFENKSVQLFNLREDIGEQHDLANAMPDKVDELRDRLHQWRQEVSAATMPPNPDYDPK